MLIVVNCAGNPRGKPAGWVVADFLVELAPRVSVTVEGRPVSLRCWQYAVTGVSGFTVPVCFLDADLLANTEWDRMLTHFLYGGDQCYRLSQGVLLGIGGVRMLRALGYDHMARFHMNEGHASLLTLEASGTSGMKAALNGVPSLRVLDGWWIEGCIEGVTGWAIGRDR
jgi:starch phosphorylase